MKIPPQINDPDFSALVRMSDWLCDEQDFFGRPPDSISMLDNRTVNWVPEGTQRQFWLIRFACDRTDGEDRGYDGVGAVWDDKLTVLGSEDEDLASMYVELLGKDPDFPVEKDATKLLKMLNPDTFDM